ncbi:uncharacterized protein LOC109595927 isoform X1 [Aethina tumida]|uniref:uncharacterized protein LOC109595927 isoform X1 n=1 Tax=Aethina tumida TaxID=116153 RepID=UPI00096AE38D|nr:uncharacterized protein LOC109595927 isoform X1 [Aethina tumida]
MMSTGKWTPQGPIRPQNCIDSSFAALKHNFGFRPQYEYEKKVHIGYLLSFEYQRMWLKEREIYEKEFYAKPAPKGDKFDRKAMENVMITGTNITSGFSARRLLKRGYIQKLMTYKKPTKSAKQDLMLKKHVSGGDLVHTDMKYKPRCFKNKPKK